MKKAKKQLLAMVNIMEIFQLTSKAIQTKKPLGPKDMASVAMKIEKIFNDGTDEGKEIIEAFKSGSINTTTTFSMLDAKLFDLMDKYTEDTIPYDFFKISKMLEDGTEFLGLLNKKNELLTKEESIKAGELLGSLFNTDKEGVAMLSKLMDDEETFNQLLLIRSASVAIWYKKMKPEAEA
jgi:hypothetical protein